LIPAAAAAAAAAESIHRTTLEDPTTDRKASIRTTTTITATLTATATRDRILREEDEWETPEECHVERVRTIKQQQIAKATQQQ